MLTVDLVHGWIFFLIQFPAAANQMRRTDSQVAVRFMKRYASYAQCCHMHLGFFFFKDLALWNSLVMAPLYRLSSYCLLLDLLFRRLKNPDRFMDSCAGCSLGPEKCRQ